MGNGVGINREGWYDGVDISFVEGQLLRGGREQRQQTIREIVHQTKALLYFCLDYVHDQVILDEEVLPAGKILGLLTILEVLADLEGKGGVLLDLGCHCYSLAHPALPFP